MPAQWTGAVIGEMHLHGITSSELANALGWHPKYLSAVLNSHRTPKKAEQKIRAALGKLIAERENQA